MPIMEQKAVILIAREGFPKLLEGPLRSRMFGRPSGLDFQRQNRPNAALCQPIKEAGLDDDPSAAQSNQQASLDNTKRSAAIAGAAFFSRSWKRANCFGNSPWTRSLTLAPLCEAQGS